MSESHIGHFWRYARQPWTVHWWERHAPFLGKKSNAFPLRPGMPRAILTLPLCFLILLFSSLPCLCSLSERIHWHALSDTHSPVADVVSAYNFCQFFPAPFPVISLLLRWGVGQLVQSSLDFFILKMTTTQEPATYISPLRRYGAKNRESYWHTPASKPIYHPSAFPFTHVLDSFKSSNLDSPDRVMAALMLI